MNIKTFRVSVTHEHIEKGLLKSCTLCPIALALRALGDQYSYVVGDRYLYNIHQEIVALLPEEARAFIVRFDAGDYVEPFEFEVIS